MSRKANLIRKIKEYMSQGKKYDAPVVDGGGVKDYNEYLQYLKKVDPSAIAAVRKENQYHRKSR